MCHNLGVAGAGNLDVTVASDGSLTAPLRLFYPYDRTVGPTFARFLTGLVEHRIEGTRGVDGRVNVPPAEFDPRTGAPLTEWVTVGTSGVVTTWGWQNEPFADNTVQQPFAWALIKLDGADTAMLHAVRVSSIDEMKTGMRVRAVWASEPTPSITAITCFEPEGA